MEHEQVYTLKRELGIWTAASIVVGTVIGSGIFLVPKTMILNVGTPAMVFAVWVAGGLLSLFGALSYAELASALPEAGGEYVYLREAYGPFWGFIYGWTQMWVAKSGSIATLASGFFLYLANFRPELERVWLVVPFSRPFEIRYGQLLAVVVILLLAVINYFGVKVGGDVQVVVTVIKVGLIAAIIVIGLGSGHGSAANYQTAIPAAGGIAGFFAALVAALWAYDGWNNVSMVSSEIRNPQRNLPLALILGTLAVIAIYLLANLAYFYVLPAAGVAAHDRVAGEMMRRILGDWGAAGVSIAAMISIFAALNGSILSGSRVPFAAARDGLFFPSFARIHPQHRTPSVSILALSAWGAVLVLSGKYDELFTYVIFASVILYGMATASVIVLRIKRPDMPRPYRTLGYPVVPILFVAAIASLIVSTLLHSPRESLLGIAIITLGVPFYLFWSGKLPSTHWGVVLLLGVVTAGVSNVVWAILQAVFVKRIDSKNKAVLFYVLSLVVGVAGFLFSLDPEAALVASALYLIAAILFQIGNFQIRGAFERVGMRLNVVLTFFLGMLYFQYHLRRIRNEDPLPYWYRAASETTKKLPSE